MYYSNRSFGIYIITKITKNKNTSKSLKGKKMNKERKIKLSLISASAFIHHLSVIVDHGIQVAMMHKG